VDREKLLSVSELAHELNLGKAMVQFILKRFKKWLPCEPVNGNPLYPAFILKKLIFIHENLEMGLLPGEVETMLNNAQDDPARPAEDIHISNDSLMLLKSLFSEIGEHQARIAAAHEKRAAAEERKAAAIEKRAEAEEKKARAMDNIATALQQMNALRSSEADHETRQIIHNAADILAKNNTDISENFKETIPDDEPENHDIIEPENDEVIEMDDLSALVDDEDNKTDELPVDDLYALIDSEEPLDDLYALIDDEINTGTEPETHEDMDDLSLLIDGLEEKADGKKTQQVPEIKIDITPEQDLAKYKSEVMKIIIGFKSDGLSVEQTTDLLNANHVKTLSGKPEWSKKAISQIYKFIESAK
jgi:hypothetical protein